MGTTRLGLADCQLCDGKCTGACNWWQFEEVPNPKKNMAEKRREKLKKKKDELNRKTNKSS